MVADSFNTDELRRRVLEAWRSSPARFRADANVEDDLALTGYRDRVVVELAQNAADAATRGGVSGRLVLELVDDVLTAANNGAPLDAAGVESISVARASAKLAQTGTVGRFGVGFAAVLAVSDETSISSTLGSVRWSRSAAVAAVASLPELASELSDRGDRVPVLRLPFASSSPPPTEAVTAVVLPLRDSEAITAVRRQLLELEPTLLLALPALREVVVRIDGDERVLRSETSPSAAILHDGDRSSRWSVTKTSGVVPAQLLVDLPVEDQRADRWQVTWALPVDADDRLVPLPAEVAGVVRAPTAVDDPLTLPAVLIASYPLDATRRRVTPGPLADAITVHAARALVTAIRNLPPDPSLLRLVPTGFPDGAVDGGLRTAVLERLQETAWLPVAGEPDVRQRPRDAVVVESELVEPLSEVVPSLLPAGWSLPALFALEVRRPALAELVEALGSVDQPPTWWHSLYAALEVVVPAGSERDVLGALPVPLADGTTVTGPRGVALPVEDVPDVDLSVIGIRMVHRDAAHPLLRSLGAVDGTPRGLLEQPQVQTAVEESYDDEDPEPVAAAVLSLLGAVGAASDELPWLADLALPDDAGEWRPAGELLLPGGRMAALVAADSAFGLVAADWVERWGAAALMAAGVLDGPAMLQESDAVGPSHDLDNEAGWWDTLPAGGAVEELVAIRDLEQVEPGAWPELLRTLAEPPWRSAVVEPAIVSLAAGGRQLVPSYTSWWLSSRPVLGGRAPHDLRLASSSSVLAALYDVAPDGFDPEFVRALGVLGSLDDADPDDVLARLADDRRVVGRDQLRAINAWLAGCEVNPPDRLRAVRDGDLVVVSAADAVIVDAPDLLPLLGDLAVVPVDVGYSSSLAERLDLPLAAELADYDVISVGQVVDGAVVHDVLLVADVDGNESEVAWRLVGDTLHVDSRHLAVGLGRGRAWRDGDWADRHRRSEALEHPDEGRMLRDEDDLDNRT